MKWLTLILSVYIIFLTAKPCDDMVRNSNDQIVTVSSELPVHLHDMCSPFCICQCCQAYFQITPLPHFEFGRYPNDHNSNYFLFTCATTPSEFLIPPEIL